MSRGWPRGFIEAMHAGLLRVYWTELPKVSKNKPGGSKVWRALRHQLSEAQNHHCAYCGVVMTYEQFRNHTVTIDHVIPISLGGGHQRSNLIAACHACNNDRGDRDADHYAAVVAKRMRR